MQTTQNLKGSFLYLDRLNRRFLIWDLSNFHVQEIEGIPVEMTESLSHIISPDGLTFAILAGNILIYVSQNQVKLFQFPVDENLYYGLEYLNDGKIMLTYPRDVSKSDSGFTDKFYIFDPVSGEMNVHSAFLPDFQPSPDNLYVLEYSSDMRYALYLSGYEDHIPQFTLFDLTESKIINTGLKPPPEMLVNTTSQPVWIPNSDLLTYDFVDTEGMGNYYTVYLDGKMEKITQFEQEEILGMNVTWFRQPSWSPDGKYMAFTVRQGSSGSDSLNIWDREEQSSLKPCVSREEQDIYRISDWALEGSYYIVGLCHPNINFDERESEAPYTGCNSYVLDMVQKAIVNLPDEENRGELSTISGSSNFELYGWLNWELP